MGSQFRGRSAEDPYKVLIAGGCYGGLSAAVNLLDKCHTTQDAAIPVEVTIVDERDGFYHLIGSPLALSVNDYAKKAWVEYKNVTALQRPNVRFVHGTVSKVDCGTRTATVVETGAERIEDYDFFVGATGLRRVRPVVPQSLSKKKYLLETAKHIDAVTNGTDPVLVVGGGAVGIEMAAELKVSHPNVKVTLAHSRDKLLSAEPLPDEVKDRALELTRDAGVDVLMNHRLAGSRPVKNGSGRVVYEVEFTNGDTMTASVVIMAISKSVPSTEYLPKAALSDGEYVNVLPTLQLLDQSIPHADRHFAVGDMINWSGIKRCGGALYEGNIAANNIHQLMLEELSGKTPEFMRLNEISPMIALAVGKTALAYGPQGMTSGEEIMKHFFEDDLGFRICWDSLRLGESPF